MTQPLACRLQLAFPSWSLQCVWTHNSYLQVLRNGIQDELYLQLCGLRPGRDLCAAVCAHALRVSECAHIGKSVLTDNEGVVNAVATLLLQSDPVELI